MQLIDGFTEEVIVRMIPYVEVLNREILPDFDLRKVVSKNTHEVILRTKHTIEKPAGYTEYDSIAGTIRYPGSPWLYYARYKLSFSGNLQAGLTVEKDPGEDFFRESNRGGFDFNSAFIALTAIGFIRFLLAGGFV